MNQPFTKLTIGSKQYELPIITAKHAKALDTAQGKLTEISQTKLLRFAFLAGGSMEPGSEMHTFHPMIKCRDYLNDVISSREDGRTYHVYGFDIGPENNELEQDATKLLLQFPGPQERDTFVANFGALRRLEQTYFNGVEPSILFHVDNKSPYLAVKGDKFWQRTTYLISLYSFWMRVILYFKSEEDFWLDYADEEGGGVDKMYLSRLKRTYHIEKLMPAIARLEPEKTCHGTAPTTAQGMIHDYTGIQGLLRSYQNKGKGNEWEPANHFAKQLAKILDPETLPKPKAA